MKRRLLSIILCTCMILTLLPTVAFAGIGDSITVSGVTLDSPGYYGVSNLDTKLDTAPTTDPKGYVHWDNTVKEPVLTLYGATITGGISSGSQPGYEIHIANGTTNSITTTTGDAISAPKTSVTIKGNGTLNVTGANTGIVAAYTVNIEGNVEANIIGEKDMGIYRTWLGYGDGVVINSTRNVIISGGNYGISCQYSLTDPTTISSANVTVTGKTAAFNDATKPVLGDTIGANASTNIDGSNPENYDSSENSSYKWFKSYALPSYDVKYFPGSNGTGTEDADKKVEGKDLTLKGAIFTREGYTQEGWATTDGGTQAYALGAKYSDDKALNLYPVWKINEYTVTYKADNNVVDTQTIKHGEDATAPAIPAKEGYDQTAPTWSNDGRNITADTVINAVYTINEYTITFTDETGIYETKTYKHGESVTMPQVPTKEGYTVKWETTIDKATKDMTIKAVYTKIIPKIILYAENGSVVKGEAVVNENGVVVSLPLASMEGYLFKGWYTKDGKKIEVSDKLTGDTELYAKWEALDNSVETGDGFNTGLYGLILAASAILSLATVAFRRKTSNN